jgi:hypothetical protein
LLLLPGQQVFRASQEDQARRAFTPEMAWQQYLARKSPTPPVCDEIDLTRDPDRSE